MHLNEARTFERWNFGGAAGAVNTRGILVLLGNTYGSVHASIEPKLCNLSHMYTLHSAGFLALVL